MRSVLFGVFLGFFCMEALASELKPYLGLNAQMRDLGFKKGYGKENFESTMPQGEFIAGLKVNPYLGFELGYFSSIERYRNATTEYPTQNLGIPDFYENPGDYTRAIGSSKINGGSLNVVGFVPLTANIQVLGSVGLARLRIKLRYLPVANELGLMSQAGTEATSRDFVHSKYIPQAKLGAQYLITQTVGLKALIGWEGTKRFNLLKNKQGRPARVSLKDSYTLGLGLAWYFN